MRAQTYLFDPADGTCPRCEEPAARADSIGVNAMADSELLALLIGGAPASALDAARSVLSEAGTVAGIYSLAASGALARVGSTAARRIAAALELARRVPTAAAVRPVLSLPEQVAAYMQPITIGLEVEKFWVLCVDRKNRLTKRIELTSGTATATLAHPREVLRAAVREAACAFICVHNHPSGDPAPSTPDVTVTRQIAAAAKACEVEFLDHVILGRAVDDPMGRGWYSFRMAGVL